MRQPTSIDLFAGCGGLARGLEWAGFDCLAFNELNEDAADSFAANFPNAMRFDGDLRTALSNKVIKSTLVPLIEARGGLDLLTGGPPCQGYSGIGHRRTHAMNKHEIPTNHLYLEMVRVIKALKPRVFLFENVEGILSSTWYDYSAEKRLVKNWIKNPTEVTVSGIRSFSDAYDIVLKGQKKAELLENLSIELTTKADEHRELNRGEIFRDVWASFSGIRGYVAQPTLLHSYGFGVPQNRPRVMILGVRKELLQGTGKKPAAFDTSNKNYAAKLRCNGGLFPTWDEDVLKAPHLIELLSDLNFTGWSEDEQPYYQLEPTTDIQRFFRKDVPRDAEGRQVLRDHEFSKHSLLVVERFQYMLDHGVTVMSDLPERLQTKKFSQKPLPARWKHQPTFTVTSLPDDYVHYSEPRSFSVREWARMQTFPDHHIFCGKRTTGGSRRAGNPAEDDWEREVPKYTQIGNAVPPLMAEAIGRTILEFLPSVQTTSQQ